MYNFIRKVDIHLTLVSILKNNENDEVVSVRKFKFYGDYKKNMFLKRKDKYVI